MTNRSIVCTFAAKPLRIGSGGHKIWKAHKISFPICAYTPYLEHGCGFCTYINFGTPDYQIQLRDFFSSTSSNLLANQSSGNKSAQTQQQSAASMHNLLQANQSAREILQANSSQQNRSRCDRSTQSRRDQPENLIPHDKE